jgi:hypothetical protein
MIYFDENIDKSSKTLGWSSIQVEEFSHIEEHCALLHLWEFFSLLTGGKKIEY